MVERCPRCGLRLEREEGAFLGSLVLNYALTGTLEIAFLVVMLILTLPKPNAVLLVVGALGIAIAVPLVFYPFAKTTWAAIDMILHPLGEVDD